MHLHHGRSVAEAGGSRRHGGSSCRDENTAIAIRRADQHLLRCSLRFAGCVGSSFLALQLHGCVACRCALAFGRQRLSCVQLCSAMLTLH